MAGDRDQWADDMSAGQSGGVLTNFLADEDRLDRRTLWRLGAWGFAAVGALIAAILTSQSSLQLRREQVASSELLARQSQQIQRIARETQSEATRLSAAIDTLNGDRDRLYSRITSIEQGLDSVTGAIKRQAAAPALQPPAEPATEPVPMTASPAPVVSPVASVGTGTPVAKIPEAVLAGSVPPETVPPVLPLMAPPSIMAPPDPAATALSQPAVPGDASKSETTAAVPVVAVQRTEFGIDIGGASSVDGLRMLWRDVVQSNKALAALRPVMMVKESSNGLGVQLRLVAGPLNDAAAAARLCATLSEGERSCETTVFDGQRLAMKTDGPAAPAPAARKPALRKRGGMTAQQRIARTATRPDEAATPAPAVKPRPALTSSLGSANQKR